ncbi:MAG: histidine ammonia-lyase [Cyclobacteriaceae bacterium]
MKETFEYGKHHLTSGIALRLATGKCKGVLVNDVLEKVKSSFETVKEIAAGDAGVYGINTGFGPLCTTRVSASETTKLQRNILMSHAVGVGEPIDVQTAKLMLILKVHALAKGFSGINPETLNRIIWHIENDAIPIVPSQGSVGASGDLAPLSHLFLPLIGLGKVNFQGKEMETPELFQKIVLEPIDLSPKEGLALINGTQFIAAHAVQLVQRLHNVLSNADITGAMMIEGLLGSVKPFSPELHQLRPYPANQFVAASVQKLLLDSEVVHSHSNCARVQDPYSLRCIPQVHGASRTAWLHLKEAVELELNSVTDNPVIINRDLTISGGNFHGQPLALPIDYACLAASEVGNISDRRVYLSLEGDTPGVPKLLMKETGTNSGFMIVQYTSAALASENKGLCFPSSADSIPTSLGQEDHVSMGSIGARKAMKVVENTEKILGVELMCAAQALDFHQPLKSGKMMTAMHAHVRSRIEHIEEDQIMYGIMEKSIELVQSGELKKLGKRIALSENIDFDVPFESTFDTY